MDRPPLSADDTELICALFARATAVTEDVHQACVEGQGSARIRKGDLSTVRRARSACASAMNLLDAIKAVIS